MKKNKKVLLFIVFCLINIVFIDIVGAEPYNNYTRSVVSCNALGEIPKIIPTVVSIIYRIIQVAVPIVLIILGMLDLMKGITSQKEDEIKKGQGIFVKRLIAAVIVFLILTIVKLVISAVADDSDIMDCAECIIENNCS